MVIGAALLGLLVSLPLPLMAAAGRVERAAEEHRVARRELANHLERVLLESATGRFDSASIPQLRPRADLPLSNARVTGQVVLETAMGARRVTLTMTWGDGRSVTLSDWIPEEGGAR